MVCVPGDHRTIRIEQACLTIELWGIVQKCWAQNLSERPDMNDVLDTTKTANLEAP